VTTTQPIARDRTRVIEVFADIVCPFTHVGLRRFIARRADLGRNEIKLWVRAWPLELVNREPLDPHFIAREVDDIRRQVAPELFTGFTEAAFPSTSLPALALAAAAYRHSPTVGEHISLALRDLLFEQGIDIADPDVLARVAAEHHLAPEFDDARVVAADHADGIARGVIGSPHFFSPTGGFFCPALDLHRDADGHLHLTPDTTRFEQFISSSLT
jgi:predicted DsbA family dithiol-disulfide isomerase